jgi:hypothetical protein
MSRRLSLTRDEVPTFFARFWRAFGGIALVMLWVGIATGQEAVPEAAQKDAGQGIEFFETKIRPRLIEHCYPCHAESTEREGGLLLDSRAGWQQGGDSGPAIVAGDPDASRLYRVIAGTDPDDLQMPPEEKLPAAVIEDFRNWIAEGAVDPREGTPSAAKGNSQAMAIDWEAARGHWAYRPIVVPQVPTLERDDAEIRDDAALAKWPHGPIDAFVVRSLIDQGLRPNPRAARATLLRRLAIDLTGLPPSPEEVEAFLAAKDESKGYEAMVDRMLASRDFAQRFARHWLDVARYAESVTLRGLVQPEAWRYRDYIIDALDRDRPWNDVIREQIAGDQMEFDSIAKARDAHVAVTFLCLGDSNLENQQKTELDMDFIDEQLDTIGRGLLGQTIGCARCHDHKFDPIPTADYYAMAGILYGSVGMEHSNVSRWIDNPLPMGPEDEAKFAAISSELEAVKRALAELKKSASGPQATPAKVVSSSALPGVVVDDTQARKVGQWQTSTFTPGYVDAGYLHDEHAGVGEKSLTFEPTTLPPGTYDVRMSYTTGSNRATRASVTVFSADGEKMVAIDQRLAPPIDGLWVSLGKYRFEAGGQAFVLVSNEGADGHVIGDAIQFLPIDAEPKVAGDGQATKKPKGGKGKNKSKIADIANDPDDPSDESAEENKRRQAELTQRQTELQKLLDAQPKAMGLKPRAAAGDLAIHLRGSIHQLGPKVPRGVLRVIAGDGAALPIAQGSDGRLELADWIASDTNPLTARVFVNRVWLWVMGEGLVRTPDNFGTTGQPPTHPELLDWLTDRFIRDGWSVKTLVKQIVMSETYRQSSIVGANDPRTEQDPDNRWWWRSDRKPLSAEALRDSVLAISGELELPTGGSTIKPGTTADYGYQHRSLTRSIYMPVFRNALPEVLETFNYADTGFVTGRRQRAIVAQQALAMLNHPWFAERATAAAERTLREVEGDARSRVAKAFLMTLSRPATPAELDGAIAFYEQCRSEVPGAKGEAQALAEIYRGLFATAEFRQPD